MNLLGSLVASLLLAYLIPVLTSLFFSLSVGKFSPKSLSQNGSIKPGFVMMYGVVWALASAVSGYEIGAMMPSLRGLVCGMAAILLIAALLANVTEMKKLQSPLQIGGMILATVAGLAGGLEIFLKTIKTV